MDTLELKQKFAAGGVSRYPSDILDNGVFQVPRKQEMETRLNRGFEDIKAGFRRGGSGRSGSRDGNR